MTEHPIPPEVERFIAEYIGSAEELEVLVLLYHAPDRAWDALAVSQSIYTVPAAATMRLESLVSVGLLASSGGANPTYRYAPANPQLHELVEGLARAYREQRVAVIKRVFARPVDPVRSFADAFKFRKD